LTLHWSVMASTDDVTEALENLEADASPLKGLILDLRDNPGGILNQAISISDLFIEEGTILTIKGRLEKHTKTFKATPNTIKRKYPIVVLINGGSASASEIVAGALQDHKRALLLGTPTFGKGSVQTVETLRDGYGLKFTIARYYTPSGKSIQAKGVLPDITVNQTVMDAPDAKSLSEKQLKEKDLKNHLESKPLKVHPQKNNPEETSESVEEISQLQAMLLEKLQKDNQAMRALEILISYEIFKDLNNG
jgi:carboxyl-terminal processing protease